MTWAQAADLLYTTPPELVRHARQNLWSWMRAGPLVASDKLGKTRAAVKAREWSLAHPIKKRAA